MCKYTGGTIVRMSNDQISRNFALTNLLGSLNQASQAVTQAKREVAAKKATDSAQGAAQLICSGHESQHQHHHGGDSTTEEEHSIGDSSTGAQHLQQKQSTIATRVRKKRLTRDHTQPEASPEHQSTVQHHYHDFASSPPVKTSGDESNQSKKSKGGIAFPFPSVLHAMLERADHEGFDDVVSWQPHGRAFMVHSPARFVKDVMPLFFRQTRFASFQRQLSLYGFLRLTRKGADHGAYYHELFVRGRSDLCQLMQRTRVKGSWVRQSSSPETEPDFASMPVVPKSSEKSVPKLPPLRNNASAASKASGASGKVHPGPTIPSPSTGVPSTSSSNFRVPVRPTNYPSSTTGFGWTNSSLLTTLPNGTLSALPGQQNNSIPVASSQARASNRTSYPSPPRSQPSASDTPLPMYQYFEPPPTEQVALAAFLCDVGLDSDDELHKELSQYDTEPLPWNSPSNQTEL